VIDGLDTFAGAERQLATNLRFFDHGMLEHEVAVIKRGSDSRAAEVEEYAKVHTLLAGVEPWTRVRVVRRLRRLVRERRPELVHATLPDSALAARLTAATTSVIAVESLVNISHEPVRTIDNPNVTISKLRFHAALDRATMRSLSGFHAVSQAVADSWVQMVGLDPGRIEVIPRGIELSWLEMADDHRTEARRSVRQEFGLPPDALLVLSVGRIEPQKGQRYLIRALASVVARYPEVRALLVGRPGISSPTIDGEIRDTDLASFVTLTGSRRDLPRILAAADIFVFPSLFEGNGGNAMSEAMAAGLPIITTDAAPMTDLVPDDRYGLLVDRRDIEGLGDALESLITNPPLRRRLGMAAQNRAKSFPTPEETADRHQQWYLKLLST